MSHISFDIFFIHSFICIYIAYRFVCDKESDTNMIKAEIKMIFMERYLGIFLLKTDFTSYLLTMEVIFDVLLKQS